MKAYFHRLGINAQSHYRSWLPAKFCQSDTFNITCSHELNSLDYDVFMLPRLLNPRFLRPLEMAQQKGAKIIHEFDDDLWHIPPTSPAYKVYNAEAMRVVDVTACMADYVAVSTPTLANLVKERLKLNDDKVKVLPNLIDLDDWTGEREEHERLRIVWAGSGYHDEDLNLLNHPLMTLLNEFPDVEVIFFGSHPKMMSQAERVPYTYFFKLQPLYPRLYFVDPVPLVDYPKMLKRLAPDIGLCQLADIPFNHSKSALKYYEYSLAGAATVASPLPPYANLPHVKYADGERLIGAWYDAIKELIVNKTLRQELAQKSYEYVVQNCTWQNVKDNEWKEFFTSLEGK